MRSNICLSWIHLPLMIIIFYIFCGWITTNFTVTKFTTRLLFLLLSYFLCQVCLGKMSCNMLQNMLRHICCWVQIMYFWQVSCSTRMLRGRPSTYMVSAWMGKETLIRLLKVLTTIKEKVCGLPTHSIIQLRFLQDRRSGKLFVWCVWCDSVDTIPLS